MATLKVSNKRQRDVQRAVYIVSGLLLMMYVTCGRLTDERPILPA